MKQLRKPDGKGFQPAKYSDDDLFHTWWKLSKVNDLEEARQIIVDIRRAAIPPKMHLGERPECFTPTMVAEWVIGQWSDIVDTNDTGFVSNARNITVAQWQNVAVERGYPKEEWSA